METKEEILLYLQQSTNDRYCKGQTSFAKDSETCTYTEVTEISSIDQSQVTSEIELREIVCTMNKLIKLRIPNIAHPSHIRGDRIILNEKVKYFLMEWLEKRKKKFRERRDKRVSWPNFIRPQLIPFFRQYMHSILSMHEDGYIFAGGIHQLILTSDGSNLRLSLLITSKTKMMTDAKDFQDGQSKDVDDFLDALCTCLFYYLGDSYKFEDFKSNEKCSKAVLPKDIKQFLTTMLLVKRKMHSSYSLLDQSLFYTAKQKQYATITLRNKILKSEVAPYLDWLFLQYCPDWKMISMDPVIELTLQKAENKRAAFDRPSLPRNSSFYPRDRLFRDHVNLTSNCDKHYNQNKFVLSRDHSLSLSDNDVTNHVDAQLCGAHGFIRLMMLLANETPGISC